MSFRCCCCYQTEFDWPILRLAEIKLKSLSEKRKSQEILAVGYGSFLPVKKAAWLKLL
jgi:hypothetical protein